MKFSNFELTKTEGSGPTNWRFFAYVDVTTSGFFWKKTERRSIARFYVGLWLFMDSGEYTPGFEVDRLAKVWTLKTGQPA